MATEKTSGGNFLEDFEVGLVIKHAVPRTIWDGDMALYVALYGDRRPLHCARDFAQSLGFERETVHDLLVFHIVFGRAVPDVSLNSPANLGYAEVRFLKPVYTGDTLHAETEVIGRRETSRPGLGIVWVHTRGFNQHGETVLQFYRWAMVNKRDPASKIEAEEPSELPAQVRTEDLYVPPELDLTKFDPVVTGSEAMWEDYEPGERIMHPQGMTLEEAEHQMATRLYQNNARVHFNEVLQKKSRLGTRIIYGGHIISTAHGIAFDGLENALRVLAFNAGAHANPTVAGDTLFAWTEVLERIDLGRDDAGALRLRLVGVKNSDPREEDVPLRVKKDDGGEAYHPNVVLDLDYTVLMPRRR
ncbi:MAG: MaoC family dehydratase [Chloroflexi bacterium]|nr:MaoC family dehydratase [Chloroflexota bacterium]MCI0813770.1 MaoC family dehydratase [Chloroflexota bacterium]MCI0817911.1 MaoC family dehydratase [Chloroflexota bacterium]MCI0831424.1 MaoC family dehydratase [Chloroflexota bacterium]MCI0838137.1 MaoC family dehydratase [Chloroflexota bacterium]